MGKAIVYTMVGMEFNISVERVEHVKGVDNVECDNLSRRKYIGEGVLGLKDVPVLHKLIDLCDPKKVWLADLEFYKFQERIRDLVNELNKGGEGKYQNL